MRRYN